MSGNDREVFENFVAGRKFPKAESDGKLRSVPKEICDRIKKEKESCVKGLVVLDQDGNVYDVLEGKVAIFHEGHKTIYSSDTKIITREVIEKLTTEER